MKQFLSAIALIAAFMLMACGGGSMSTTPPPKSGGPLDPQGNWIFTLTSSNRTIQFAGQLYELVPPTVTSNPMGAVNDVTECMGSLVVDGQASGTNSITMNVNQINDPRSKAKFVLAGTIATDEKSMSGTWTSTDPGDCQSQTSGTWSARTITSVTGSWSGTMIEKSGNALNITASLALNENTDQTSANMGQITGTVTIVNSACFDPNTPLSLPTWAEGGYSSHGGLNVYVATADTNGQHIEISGTADVDSTTYTVTAMSIIGGSCDGQTFSGSFTR